MMVAVVSDAGRQDEERTDELDELDDDDAPAAALLELDPVDPLDASRPVTDADPDPDPDPDLDADLDVDLDAEPEFDTDPEADLVSDVTPEAAEAADDAEPDLLYTIDELASMSGVPSRTIRFYQSKGTLPAPERRGRVAFYRPEHVERLKVIAELQDRGLRLDAIRDALSQLEKGGDSLQAWLGMGDELQSPWSDDQPVVVTEDDLIARMGGNRPGMIGELRRYGMIERQGNSRPATYIVPSPGLLDIALKLEQAGVEPMTAFEARETMRRPIAKMSDELVEFFAQRAGQGFGGHGEPHEIARSFEALQHEGTRALQLIFAQEMERALREFVERGGAMPQTRRNRPPEPRPKPAPKRTSRKPERKAERREHRDRHSGRASE